MSLFGVGLDVEVKRIHLKMKLAISKRGGSGIHNLKKIFKTFDYNGNGKMDIKEFEEALAEFGLFTKVVELQALHKFYDKDGDGDISFQEFMNAFREPLSKRRYELVTKVF